MDICNPRGVRNSRNLDDTSPEDDDQDHTVSSASLCLSPLSGESRTDGPLVTSTPIVEQPRTLSGANGFVTDASDKINGNFNANTLESTTSIDILSGGESDAGETLSRRNNNSISTGTFRHSTEVSRRRSGDISYLVAKELLMTERTYKRDLELVTVSWSSRVSGLAARGVEAESVAALARASLALGPPALAQGALLARLERLLSTPQTDNEDPEYTKVSDLLKDYLSSIFDTYSSYMDSVGFIAGRVESVRRMSQQCDRECCEFEQTAPLPLCCLLLRPLHRVLHYNHIAKELANSEGSQNAVLALDLSSQLCKAARAQLAHSVNHTALCRLQRDIIGYEKLLIAEREFLRMGCLYKQSPKGLQQRMLFLFSDIIIIASKHGSCHFRAHVVLPVHKISVRPEDSPNTFTIMTDDDSSISFRTSDEYQLEGWLSALNEAVETASDDQLPVDTQVNSIDAYVDTSSNNNQSPTGGLFSHVCWHRVMSIEREQLHIAFKTQLSGYLLRKFKNSHGWQKLWVVFAAFTLYFYKSWQEPSPLASLPLLGYTVGPPLPNDAIHKDFVFKLQFKNHVYFFRADSQYSYNRWTDVIQTAVANPKLSVIQNS